MNDELKKELDRIERDYGKGSVIHSSSIKEKVDVISTGSVKLDLATGIGGLPRGKVVEIIGWESSGKSTITLQTIANAQKQGLECLLVDGENAFDTNYARNLGVDTDKLLIKQLDQGGAERAYDIAERLLRTRKIGMVVFDSQTSLLTKKALEEDNGTSLMGLQARMMSISVPKIVNAAALGSALVVYISQFREKIGVIFGTPETTSGGNALKFYAHMRIEMRKSVLRDEKSKEAYANKTTCKIIKNKLAAPFKEASFRINFGTGVDKLEEIFDLATELDIIKSNGAHYYYNESRIGHGELKVLEMLKDNPGLTQEIENKVKQIINGNEARQTQQTEPESKGTESTEQTGS